MASKQIEAVEILYRNWGDAFAKNPEMPLNEWRDMIETWPVLTSEPEDIDYLETSVAGVPAMWAVPKRCADDRVILSVHGGGFVTGSMYTHRKLFGHIAKAIGGRALILNFRRSPEHLHPAQMTDVVAVYKSLLDEGLRHDHIAFVGDSAGGGLCITSQIKARELGLPLPAGAILMSPWVDMEVIGESWAVNREKDVLFKNKEMVQGLANMFLGADADRRDPLVNPLYANLSGLSPIYIQVGGNEVLLDDSCRLAERAQKFGVEVTQDVFPEMQHTFQMCAGRAPEADEAICKIARWTRTKLHLLEERDAQQR